MNVLVLTPDRVGSSFLQRLITIYMNALSYDKNVINIHELVDNNLLEYFNPDLNQQAITFDYANDTGIHYRTLPDIVDLMDRTNHYKVARLTWFNLRQRLEDTESDRQKLYDYVNKNFYIISARRDNLFEYALSWAIAKQSHKMNVYSAQEKFDSFKNIYRDRLYVDPEIFITHLYHYREYCAWADRCFHVSSIFHYDRYINDMETYLLNLNIYNGQKPRTWKEMFGLDFDTWNRCHYLASDISGLGRQLDPAPDRLLLTYSGDWTQLKIDQQTLDQVPVNLTKGDRDILQEHGRAYLDSLKEIDRLLDLKILPRGVPIKLQTFLEKRLLVKNFDQLVDCYNQVISDPSRSLLYQATPLLDNQVIDQSIEKDIRTWHVLPQLENNML